MIHEHLEYPSREQWIEIEEKSKISQLYLDVVLPEMNDFFSFFRNQELLSWVRLFNNRLGQARMSYVFFMHYYNKGIPDEEWMISPGNEGQSIQYFPHFNEETFDYKLMFDYYIDNFYYKFFSAWDTLYHILNVYYQFDIPSGYRFSSDVMKQLHQKNQKLHKAILQANRSKPFKLSRNLRNDITHNFAPNDISSGVSKQKENGKIKKISFGVGNYTPSNIFVENIDGIIEKFILLLQQLKTCIEGK